MDKDKYDAMQQQLQNIVDIGFDYDGYSKPEDLKSLIDELISMARDGLKGVRPFYTRHGKCFEYVTDDDGNLHERELPEEKIPEYAKNFLKRS